jgi:hypothetical protein
MSHGSISVNGRALWTRNDAVTYFKVSTQYLLWRTDEDELFSEIGGVLSITPTHTILSSQCNVSDLKPRERLRADQIKKIKG